MRHIQTSEPPPPPNEPSLYVTWLATYYKAMLMKGAIVRGVRPQEAEDFIHEFFVDKSMGFAGFKTGKVSWDDFISWPQRKQVGYVRSMLRTFAIDQHRRATTQTRGGDKEHVPVEAAATDLEANGSSKSERANVVEALSNPDLFSDDERDVIMLYRFSQLERPAIAARLSEKKKKVVTEEEVGRILVRAGRKLHRILYPEEEGR